MSGRIVSGMLADVAGWRVALGAIGVLSLISAFGFIRALPPSRHFRRRPFAFRTVFGSLGRCLRDPGLRLLYVCSFLLVGSLVALYNYIGFELMAPPYNLSAALVSWIFLVYLVGTISSTLMGRLADRYGRGVIRVSVAIMLVGAVATLAPGLPLKLLGLALFTFGFFGSHSIASGWVGARAGRDVAPASGLYLFFFYLGSSLTGTGGGVVYAHFGWAGLIALLAGFLSVALAATTLLGRMERKARRV
jgi:YNFM family putative membrane transporter